jgi:hypothetical protein
MRKVYVLDLSEEEKAQLESLTKKGKTSARKLNRRARVLLLANQGETRPSPKGCGSGHLNSRAHPQEVCY